MMRVSSHEHEVRILVNVRPSLLIVRRASSTISFK